MTHSAESQSPTLCLVSRWWQTGSSVQNQMYWLPGYLYWGDWQNHISEHHKLTRHTTPSPSPSPSPPTPFSPLSPPSLSLPLPPSLPPSVSLPLPLILSPFLPSFPSSFLPSFSSVLFHSFLWSYSYMSNSHSGWSTCMRWAMLLLLCHKVFTNSNALKLFAKQ